MQVLINEHNTTIEMLIPFLDLYSQKKNFQGPAYLSVGLKIQFIYFSFGSIKLI